MKFNLSEIQTLFPELKALVHNKPLVYLDNAASTLKLDSVIKRLNDFYSLESANIHRGVHFLSEHGTIEFEKTRDTLMEFLNTKFRHEIIFTKGTTESINLLASSFTKFIKKDDVILLSTLEHHSNIVPWQMLAERCDAKVIEIPINDQGEIILSDYQKLLKNNSVKIVSVNWVSNALGTINPISEMIKMAHEQGSYFHVDAAQGVGHMRPDVTSWDADFVSFSSHKMFGPFGVGVLYGKEKLLNMLPPYQGGGDMIDEVTFAKTTYNTLPHKFEAGTPVIAEVIAFKMALDFLINLDMTKMHQHEQSLLDMASNELKRIEGLRIIGEAKNKASVVSFVIDGIHHHDLGLILDRMGIAVRTGHHCTQPLMKRFGITGTTRASFSIYNSEDDVAKLVSGIKKAKTML